MTKRDHPMRILANLLHARFSAAIVDLDAGHPEGTWHLDVALAGHTVNITWSAARGFGITSDPEPGYGEGPHELEVDVDATYARVVELMTHESRTRAGATQLPGLRKRCGITQEELAARLGIRQASVSKLERRTDLRLSTLDNVIRALGGRLDVRAWFPSGEVAHVDCVRERPEDRR